MRKVFKLSLVFLLLLALGACEKPEGEGGRATIKGKIIAQLREPVTNTVIAEYPYLDERVFIVYGKQAIPIADDDTRTSFNGWYSFSELNPGDYTIYAYSECLGCPEQKEPVIKQVNIGKNDDEVIAETIYVTVY
jgi:hypothetical protein